MNQSLSLEENSYMIGRYRYGIRYATNVEKLVRVPEKKLPFAQKIAWGMSMPAQSHGEFRKTLKSNCGETVVVVLRTVEIRGKLRWGVAHSSSPKIQHHSTTRRNPLWEWPTCSHTLSANSPRKWGDRDAITTSQDKIWDVEARPESRTVHQDRV